ncbi:18186_t:CDS:2, partial [Gigaspora margarita]
NRDKLEVSTILCGISLFGGFFDEVGKSSSFEAVSRALELDSEKFLGSVLSSLCDKYSRSHYYLFTKVGRYGLTREDFDYSPKHARESVEESCRRLKTELLMSCTLMM